ENCGTSLNATDLINPRSAISGSKPVLRETKHWYLPLDKHEAFLKDWILEQNKNWKSNVYGQCKSWLDQGLQPRAVSRDLDWGIPVPVEGADGKVLYVWFDAPIGYISATKELTPDWEKWWKDEETRLVHFIGKDNIVFHCIIFPSMLKAEGSFILPDNVPANEFLNLEGDKISTSRNWAVWLHEYLEDFKGKEDVLRYVLTANMPETKDNDFTWKDFQSRNNNELVAIYGNFVNRTLILTQKYFDGKVPAPVNLTEEDQATLKSVADIKKGIEDNLEAFRFREALKEMMNLARLGNKYLADTEPWKVIKTDPERVKDILYVSLQITANLAVLSEPFLPFSASKLIGFLNFKNPGWEHAGSQELLQPGHQMNNPDLLFEKVEDSEVEAQLNKLMATKKANDENEETKVTPAKDNISFDDFSRMDIRTATIIEAEKVPKTKKLLKLRVDTGIDKRTIVSGIAEFYEPENIVGRQISMLVNLEPRKIRGIESQGMILMAEDDEGKLTFVSPADQIKNGSMVK
ncbi:MAG TPA: methionine--tRNA ligase, partial [Bacteroidales bacterium]|nr:methionine--tRNA ligase [Bacteroidales bacterium]